MEFGLLRNVVASMENNGLPETVCSAPLTIPLVIGSPRLNSAIVANGVVSQEVVTLPTAEGPA